ncbi:MAG: peptide-methionine (S)-S-oxide reductase [Spirochaetaceae bacterium]|nr:MAG: peptide-methionine (S)-S-oxide reductase [Spirochaetaceae bacterium]
MKTRQQRIGGVLLIALAAIVFLAAGGREAADAHAEPLSGTTAYSPEIDPAVHGVATFGGGCFWCVEAVFQRVDGVVDVVSGYAGGHIDNPTYEQVITGTTGHAEVVQVVFDRSVISYEEILDWFFRAHDPTTLNRQGNDIGPHYRSIVLHHDPEQERIARAFIEYVQRDFGDPIVTEVVPLDVFFKAEEYHQNYYDRNRNAGYCVWVIRPKLESLGL